MTALNLADRVDAGPVLHHTMALRPPSEHQRGMMKRLCVVGATSLLCACGPVMLEPRPLEISVAASKASAAVGDTLSFVATVQGTNLLGLDADFGDGGTDRYGTAGARAGKVTFRHPFIAPGTYTVKITATDSDASQKSASVSIQVL